MVLGFLQELWPQTELNRNAIKKIFTSQVNSRKGNFLILLDKTIAGHISLEVSDDYRMIKTARIRNFIISEEYRGKGIGKKVMKLLEKTASQQHCGMIEVSTELNRKRAQKFYEKNGFINTSLRYKKKL